MATFTLAELRHTATGASVTCTALVKASTRTTVGKYGIAVQSTTGVRFDYPMQSRVTITRKGTRTTTSPKTFPAGVYTYWAAIYTGGRWVQVGETNTFTVGAVLSPDGTYATVTASVDPSVPSVAILDASHGTVVSPSVFDLAVA